MSAIVPWRQCSRLFSFTANDCFGSDVFGLTGAFVYGICEFTCYLMYVTIVAVGAEPTEIE